MNKNLPERLIIFVTTKCDLRCKHCFFSYALNKQIQELEPEDVKKIMDNYSDSLESIIVTGGEPFLNKNLVGIICNLKSNSVSIPTNGNNPSLILEKTEELMNKIKTVKKVNISVSLDGPENIHNKIRGIKGSYKNALETFQGLKKLEEKYPNLSIGFGATISDLNIEYLNEMAEFAWNLGEKSGFQMARSVKQSNLPQHLRMDASPLDESSTIPDDFPEKILEKMDVIKNISFKNLLIGIRQSGGNFFKNLLKNLIDYFTSLTRLRAFLITIKSKKRVMPCFAGDKIGVIYSNLDVSFCEFMKPIGNLKDYNFRLQDIWFSKKADDMRKVVSKCFCAHPCFVSYKKYDLRRFGSIFWNKKI